MTPTEKAKYLVDKFYWSFISEAKQCALICVGEIVNERSKASGFNIEWENDEGYLGDDRDEFWEKVKEEINKL